MTRLLISFAIGIPALLFSIYVFGWIVSGEMNLLALKINRERQPLAFWAAIIVLCVLSLALLTGAFLYSTGSLRI